ncbi:hypothetical protein BGZ83_008159 [Gryganskiella cystojenkinii]|nr:hypothetical protein BGZ83_008159 [Gryganskiella cystojenkinii]
MPGVSIDELERMGILQTKLLKLTGTLYSPKSYASQLLAATAAASSTTSLMTTTTITTTNNNNKKSIPVPTTVQDEDLHYESDNDNDNDSDAESVVLPREDDRLRKQIAQACYPSRREEYRKRKKERQQPTQLRRSTRQQPRQSRLFRKSPSPVQQQQRQQHQQSSSRTSEEQKRKVVAPSSPTGINLTTVQWNRPFANPSSALLCCSENACYPDEDLEKPLPPLPPLSPPPPREVATQTSATANPPSSSYAYSSSGSVSVDENACFMVNEASLSSPVSSSTPSPSGGDTAWSQVPPMPSLSSIAQYQSIPFHYQPQFPSSSSSRLAAAVTTPTVLNTYQIGIQTAQQLRPIINTTAATVPPKMATLTSTTTATTTTATTSSSSKSRPVLLLTSPTIVHRGKSIRNSKRRNTTSRRSQRRHQQQILLAPNSNPIAIALLKQNSADRQDGEWVEEGVVTEEMSELELAVLLGAHLQTLRKANQFLEEFDRQALASQQGMDQFTRAKEVYERWLALFLSSSTTTSHSKATTGPRSSSLPIYRRRPTIRHATQVQYLQEQKLLQQQQRYHLQLKQLRPLPPVPTTEKRKSQHIRLLQQQQQLAMLQQYREQQELDLQFRTQQQHVRQKSLARRHTRRSGHRTTVSSLGSGGTVSGRTSRTATKRQAKK